MADPTSRIVRLRGVRRARGLLPLTSPVEVARRLAALERQVERALGSPERRGMSWTALERVLDRSLDGYGLLQRALGGERTAAAEVAEAPLDVLYRWWWRIEVIGRERLPRRGPVLVVANRGGSLMPYEAFMLARAFTSGHDDEDGTATRQSLASDHLDPPPPAIENVERCLGDLRRRALARQRSSQQAVSVDAAIQDALDRRPRQPPRLGRAQRLLDLALECSQAACDLDGRRQRQQPPGAPHSPQADDSRRRLGHRG